MMRRTLAAYKNVNYCFPDVFWVEIINKMGEPGWTMRRDSASIRSWIVALLFLGLKPAGMNAIKLNTGKLLPRMLNTRLVNALIKIEIMSW